LSLDIIDRDKIKNANLKNISYSEFVKNTVGVAAVCEPAAILSSNNGKLILKKTKYDQVTIALVEEEIAID
ncbi:MAG: cobalamin biosynthesis protein, partial [Halanaerobiales bacterium]